MQNSPLYDPMIQNLPTPAYVVYEERLRANLAKLKHVSVAAGVHIIPALKANALWKTFYIFREYFDAAAVSSVNEMLLAHNYLAKDIHAFCPVYTEKSFGEFLQYCSHIIFNSFSQFEKYRHAARRYDDATHSHTSLGIRVNPKQSVIDHDIYNPAVAGSRFGVSIEKMPDILPHGVEGFHFHALCECGAEELKSVLEVFETKFGKYLPLLKWVNFGGGHLITRKDYNIKLLIDLLQDFKKKHPNLTVYLEPGSAFTWQTGDLITEVLDIVEDEGIKTAIIDASFACHMPDCLEMPYKPAIAEALPEPDASKPTYRLGGNTCLAGDFVGDWSFPDELKPSQKLTILDMNHYTTVKTHMFNGVQHPSIWLITKEGEPNLLREYTYDDYKDRMC